MAMTLVFYKSIKNLNQMRFNGLSLPKNVLQILDALSLFLLFFA